MGGQYLGVDGADGVSLKIVLSWNVRSLYHKWSNRHHLPLTQIHIRTYVHINSTNACMCRSLFTCYSVHNLVLNLIFTGCVLHESTIGLRLFSWRTNLRNACSRIQSYYDICEPKSSKKLEQVQNVYIDTYVHVYVCIHRSLMLYILVCIIIRTSTCT